MDLESDVTGQAPMQPASGDTSEAEATPSDLALVSRLCKTILGDRGFFKKDFEFMRRCMKVARTGHDTDWAEGNYTANILGRHVKQKAASLYAKNPKAVARTRPTLDFAVWDENEQTMMLAFQTLQQGLADQAVAQQAAIGHNGGPALDGMPPMAPTAPVEPPALSPQAQQAQELIADFQQGMKRRQMMRRIGQTLEVLFDYVLREQTPLDFKTAMKKAVRRTCVTGVGYVEIGFQRETGPRPGLEDQLADFRVRLDHLRRLSEEASEGDISDTDAEMAELERSTAALTAEPEILLREGLIFDFPASTRVIPDKRCTSLVGFIGCRHLTIEYLYTPEEVEELFNVDLKGGFTPYSQKGERGSGGTDDGQRELNFVTDGKEDGGSRGGLVCVWKHYDKASGLVYYLADGFKGFLRDPAAPDVFVPGFWPVFALTFNETESEEDLFPPSDVALALDMQKEYNRSRQGAREHRQAARPRWAFQRGLIEEDDQKQLKTVKPFDAISMNLPPNTKLADVLQVIPVPGVDPNLYETSSIFQDMQLVVGSSQANLGTVSKATATESAIAANSAATSDGDGADDLDAFLTLLARAAGQILLREMSPEKVREIAGPGAVWPEMELSDIASELYLEIEAGSSGKPNQAVEVNNWKQLLPLLMQIPGINPTWLAKETIRRLDDRVDLTEALASGVPSIIMQNQQKQPAPSEASPDGPNAPEQQGPAGANNGPPAPSAPSGTGPAFGSNQV